MCAEECLRVLVNRLKGEVPGKLKLLFLFIWLGFLVCFLGRGRVCINLFKSTLTFTFKNIQKSRVQLDVFSLGRNFLACVPFSKLFRHRSCVYPCYQKII